VRGINTVVLFGNLGRDPESRRLPSGVVVCTLRLATHRSVKEGEGWRDHTDWHNVDLWERNAEVAERFLRKGDPVGVEGQLRESTWTDAQEQRRSRSFVHGHRLHLIGRRRDGVEAATPPLLTGA